MTAPSDTTHTAAQALLGVAMGQARLEPRGYMDVDLDASHWRRIRVRWDDVMGYWRFEYRSPGEQFPITEARAVGLVHDALRRKEREL